MAEGALIGAATATAKWLAKLVATRAWDEIKLTWGFNDELQKFKEKLEYIQAFLDDASSSKHAEKSELVKLWVQKVKDAAYLADDLMDEYAIEIFERNMKPKDLIGAFDDWFTPSNSDALFLNGMAHKVMEILSLFDEIDKDANRIGLSQVAIATTSVTHTPSFDKALSEARENAAASASKFVGREFDLAKLLDGICSPLNDGRDLSTIAVIGMGGVGKTTLARRLYDHKNICAHFDIRIWIRVSKNFDINIILNEMVEVVTARKFDLSNRETMIGKLQEKSSGKKLLIVLDDVWNTNEDLWDALVSSIGRTWVAPGSVILTTTRLDEVAKAAEAVYKHKLKGLSKDESWSLFSQIVSNNNWCLVEIGKRIVEKCKGLPLAIKVIGRLLHLKKFPHEWEAIEKSELWEGKLKILPSLLLSFNHLPSPSVKQCFAYHAMIRKGFYLYKHELIAFWLSQGYLRKRNKLTMEEVGEENLKILVSNSLLEEYVPPGLDVVCYMMHDLVYDLAVYVCGSDLIKEAKDLHLQGSCRHLEFKFGEYKATSDIPPKKVLMNLRTIRFTGGVAWNFLIHMRHLRTLLLDNTGITEVPETIDLLKHLRYIDVSYNPISTLPDSIGKLYQLQALIHHGCENMKLPKAVYKLVNLRHISTNTPMFAWKGLQQLTNLQSLPALCLDNDGEGWSIDELGDLHELRDEIHIQGLECVKDKEQARNSGFAGKAQVSKLTLSWDEERERNIGGICEKDILEGFEPYPDMTSLELHHAVEAKFPILNKLLVALIDVLTVGENVSGLTLSWTEAREEAYPNISSLKLPKIIDTDFPALILTFSVLYDFWLKKTDPSLTSLIEPNLNLTLLFEPNTHFRSLFKPDPHFTSLIEHLRNPSHARSLQRREEVKTFIDEKFPTLFRLMVGIEANLAGKELTLSWEDARKDISGGINDQDVLEGLEPHQNITSLEIKNFLGVKFPTWIAEMAVLTEAPRGNRTKLNNITVVKLLNCSSCQTLPKLGQLPLLKCLILSGLLIKHIGIEFYGGEYLDIPGVISFQNLRELEISRFRRLTTWKNPPNGAFPSLEKLRIKECKLLKSVPAFECESLMCLELVYLYSVGSLDISKYSSGLTSLIMNGLHNIVSLPQELADCRKLQVLEITNFERLASLQGLESLINLQSMTVAHCSALNFVMGDLLHVHSSLRVLEIVNCPSLKKIPINLEEYTSLEMLVIQNCPMIESSPTNISKLRRLLMLKISCSSAEHLRSILESAKDLPLLRTLKIEGFRDEEKMSDYFSDITPFLHLLSLTQLFLHGHPNIRTLPQQLGLLTRITLLGIHHFDDLEEIRAWIHNLSSLACLALDNCKNLKRLPSKEALEHLTTMLIEDCPLLTKRYARDGGSDWHTISHIPNISMDGKTIQEFGK